MERRINTNRNQSVSVISFPLPPNVFLCFAHLKGEQQAAQSMERSSIINLRLDCLSASALYKTTSSGEEVLSTINVFIQMSASLNCMTGRSLSTLPDRSWKCDGADITLSVVIHCCDVGGILTGNRVWAQRSIKWDAAAEQMRTTVGNGAANKL